MTEPWLRGPLENIHPLLAPLLFSFQQAREDLRKWTEGISLEQLWARAVELGRADLAGREVADRELVLAQIAIHEDLLGAHRCSPGPAEIAKRVRGSA